MTSLPSIDVLLAFTAASFVLIITPGPDMMQWFGLKTPAITYGRLAIIHCDGQPAVELLEIVAPED